VNGSIGTPRQRFANHLRRSRRARRHDDDFAGVLLFQAQRLFERVGVRLVELEARVLIANPGLGVVDSKLPLPRHDLFDSNGYFHAESSVTSFQLPVASCQRLTGN